MLPGLEGTVHFSPARGLEGSQPGGEGQENTILDLL